MPAQVSVIIVSYNSWPDILNCLESINQHTQGVDYEIIVVDNGSTNDSFQELLELQKRIACITLLPLGENKGFGAANNIGAKQATGDYLLFLNPDTLLINDAISEFYQFLEKSEKHIAACGGRLQKPNGEYAVSFGHFPTLFQQFSDIGFRALYKNHYNRKLSLSPPCDFTEPRKVEYLSGADIFIRKAVFDELGGFDDRFFMYYEDTDLLYRLEKAGYQAYLLPQVQLIHKESAPDNPDGSFNYTKYSMLEKSKYLYFRKNHEAGAVFWSKVFQLISLMTHWKGRYRYRLSKVVSITTKE
jgi:GT2 family glycosyltransferase